ncbi:MAG: hypothetical protein IJ304_01505 [Clostridia bacterium]|nr:hypothetical protein [Clostridia bacterium]
MTLFVYDFEFNLLFVETGIIKSRWVVYYNDVGTFEVHLPITSELTRIVSENPYLVVKQHGLSAIIVGKELGDELVLYGRTCNWLLSKRITPEFELDTVYSGDAAANMVNTAFSDVDNLVIGNIPKGNQVEFESMENETLDSVRDCLKLSNLGHELCYNEKTKSWEFNVLEGIESELILSEAHRNAFGTKISSDILDMATCGVYNKKTDDGYTSTNITGDTEKTGIYRWEAKVLGETENEAKINLEKLTEKNKISMETSEISWKKDYALGDVVRIQIIKGAYRTTEKKRVSGVEITTRQGEYSEQPIFE